MLKNIFCFRKKAFTLIELLAVIFIIALLASIAFFSVSSSRQKGSDIKRITDITQIQIALENYNRLEGHYPEQLTPGEPLVGPSSGVIFMSKVPVNSAYKETECPFVGYDYFYDEENENYELSFCLENPVENYTAGIKCANSSNILNTFCSIPSFTLAYTAGAGGSISGSASQSVEYEQSGSAVTAVPDTGYSFVKWSDDSTANPRTDSNVMADISVSAQFSANQYALSYSAGSNGSLSGQTSQTVGHGGSGSAVSAVPDSNYSFLKWSDDSTANPRTDSNVTSNITVNAQFAINQYTLTYNAGSGGSITGSSPQTVDHGSNGSQVTAVANTGYSFTGWSDDVMTASRTETNVTANKTVTANFTINQYTLTYTAGSGGSITGSSPQTVNHGSSGSAVTAVPNTGYSFLKWSDDSTANPRTDSSVTGDVTVSAQFVINQYTLTYTAGSGGSISGSSPQTVNHGSSGSAVTAVPDSGVTFLKWSDDSTSNPRTDSNVTGNVTVSAIFTVATSNFAYTGDVQQYTILVTGTYKMTATGAKGGDGYNNSTSAGGAGGQAIGNREFQQGDVLYIYVGGAGARQSSAGQAGGWNGGGNAYSTLYATASYRPGTGGGASDIRLNGTALGNRVIVGAGGGGGAGRYASRPGGQGGGTTGQRPTSGGYGGTQSAGGSANGALGQGGAPGGNLRGSGGGGYYGGGASATNYYGGGGGSSYITGLSSSSTTQGVNSSGHGSISIEYVP